MQPSAKLRPERKPTAGAARLAAVQRSSNGCRSEGLNEISPNSKATDRRESRDRNISRRSRILPGDRDVWSGQRR